MFCQLFFFVSQFTADLIEAGGGLSVQAGCGHVPGGKCFLILRRRDQAEEIRLRIADIDAGTAKLIPADEVFAKIRHLLK